MAFVVGITSARSGDWKRGVAANVAARLAADADIDAGPRRRRVAVVDVDAADCDVGDRLGMAVRGSLEWPRLTVVPAARDLTLPAARRRVDVVAADHDVVVVDLPRGAGVPGPALEAGLLDRFDRLVVALELTPDAVRRTARWVELVARAKVHGHLPGQLSVVAVVVGENVGDRADRRATADAVGVPVVAGIPQLWGRAAPNLGFGPTLGFDVLDDALRAAAFATADQVSNSRQPASHIGHSFETAHGAVAFVK